MIRTYAGHTNPRAANELFRKNLAKPRAGLSVAFDLSTQRGTFLTIHRRRRGRQGWCAISRTRRHLQIAGHSTSQRCSSGASAPVSSVVAFSCATTRSA
ncbi:MAG: methylmalonyl-CoA mutase family protein [Candidatus Binatia bacterium]